jgi:hypothetical protein
LSTFLIDTIFVEKRSIELHIVENPIKLTVSKRSDLTHSWNSFSECIIRYDYVRELNESIPDISFSFIYLTYVELGMAFSLC